MKTDDFIGYLETVSAQVSPAQWSINLMDYQYNKRSDKCCYQFWRVNLQPEDALSNLVRDICSRYISDYEKIEAVEPYYGVTQARTIYTFESSNELIQTSFDELKQQLAQAGDFSSGDENKAKGYAISGEINIDDTIIPVKIFNLSIPFKAVKHRFMMSAGEFKEIQSKVLTLQNSTCLIAIGEVLYMLDPVAEKLFNLERSFKKASAQYIDQIVHSQILSDAEFFAAEAGRGFNPRTLISFSEKRLEYLSDSQRRRKEIAQKYSLDLDDSDNFVTESATQVRALVKLLCGRAMEDPLNSGAPMEVPSSKAWSNPA